MPVHGHVKVRPGHGTGELELGGHEIAHALRELGISPKPFLVMSYLEHRAILPPGHPVGPARAYDGYRGAERELGRFTVRYPGTGPVDQYAGVLPTAG